MNAKMGRPKSKDPKIKRLELKLTESENERLNNVAEKLKTTRTNVFLKGLELVEKELDK